MAERRIVHPMAISNADLRQAQRHEQWAKYSVVALALAGLGLVFSMLISSRPSVDVSRIYDPEMLDGMLRGLQAGDKVTALLDCTLTAQNPPGSTLGLAIRDYPSVENIPQRRLADGETIKLENPVMVLNDRGVPFFTALKPEHDSLDAAIDRIFGRAFYVANLPDTSSYRKLNGAGCEVPKQVKIMDPRTMTAVDVNGVSHNVGIAK